MQSESTHNCQAFATLLIICTVSVPARAESPGPISEETPPAACDVGSLVKEIKCNGRYCDDITISCMRFPDARLGRTTWTPWVSEEKGGSRSCPNNYFVAGLACRGKYCDNLSLFCIEVTNARRIQCSQTPSVSEENGGRLSFFRGDKAGQLFAATGVRCRGRYCDNKAFTVCEIALE